MNAFTFAYFFAAASDIPTDIAIGLFSLTHILYSLAMLVMAIIISFYYRNLRPRQKSSFKKNFSLFILFYELLRFLAYVQMGRFSYDLLPLHLCGISEFLIFGYAFTKNKYLNESLYALGLIGAVMALTFSDWLNFPFWHFQTIHSFTQHGFLLSFVLMLLISGELKPNVKNLPVVFIGLLITMVPLYYLNQILGTNFFFLAYPSPGSPLVLFEQIAGNPGYIFLVLALLLFVWLLMYLPFMGKRNKARQAYKVPVRRSV